MSRELRTFFDRMAAGLLTLARDGKPIQLTKQLEDYSTLLKSWLQVAPRGLAIPFSLAAEDQPFVGPLAIGMPDLLRAAHASGDSETFRIVIDVLAESAMAARGAEQPRLHNDFCVSLGFAHYLGMRTESLRATVSDTFDRHLHGFLMTFKCRSRSYQNGNEASARETFEYERPFLDAALSMVLTVLATAMEEAQTTHAQHLFERLVEYQRFERSVRRHDQRAPMAEDVDTLHDYTILTLVGWALHVRDHSRRQAPEAANAVLDLALARLTSRRVVVGLWELYHAGSAFESEVDQRLGTDRWDLRDRENVRVGVPITTSGGSEWRTRGLYAAILAGRDVFPAYGPDYFQRPAPRYMWDVARAGPILAELSAEARFGASDTERQGAADAALALIREREMTAASAYAKLAATAPLDPERTEKLKRETLQAMATHQIWSVALRKIGDPSAVANFASPAGLEVTRYLPRDYLIAESSWASGFGEWIGEYAGLWDSMHLVALAEQTVDRGPAVTALATLPEAVREARRTLVNRGYKPNIVIVPREDRFVGALFQRPLWQVEDRHTLGEMDCGTWEGLRVMQFPYSDPRSVLVADSRSLFGMASDRPSQPVVSIHELTPEEVAALRERRAAHGEKREGEDRPEIMVKVRSRPLFGIIKPPASAKPDAALSLDITDAGDGYAVTSEDTKSHRPEGPEIGHSGNTR